MSDSKVFEEQYINSMSELISSALKAKGEEIYDKNFAPPLERKLAESGKKVAPETLMALRATFVQGYTCGAIDTLMPPETRTATLTKVDTQAEDPDPKIN